MEMSPEIHELAAALAKAQSVMPVAKKDGRNPHYGSDFCTLKSIWDAARAPLSTNNLAVIQTASTLDGQQIVTITTVLVHSSGQWIKDILSIAAKDINPQSVGSVISYGRRYQLAAMVGIVPEGEDDDAEGGEGRHAGMKPIGENKNPAPKPIAVAPKPTIPRPAVPQRTTPPPPPMGPRDDVPPISDKDIPF